METLMDNRKSMKIIIVTWQNMGFWSDLMGFYAKNDVYTLYQPRGNPKWLNISG